MNTDNEKMKYKYRIYLAHVEGRDKKTWLQVIRHITKFEKFTEYKEFQKNDQSIIHNYIESMLASDVGISFADHNVKALRRFYQWLSMQKGYRSKIDPNLANFFQLSVNQRRIARAPSYRENYELADVKLVISKMPDNTITERRNKALVSLQALCGLRISELRTIKMKNFIYSKDTERYFVYVDPKDMSVKFAKTRQAFVMPFEQDWLQNVLRWKEGLQKLGWGDKDPLFPIIPNQFNQLNMLEPNIKKIEIRGNNAILKVFHDAFTTCGLPYYPPHTFRHMIARWAETKSPEVFNAVRQSLGHSDIKTTFEAYGTFTPRKIANILNKAELQE